MAISRSMIGGYLIAYIRAAVLLVAAPLERGE